MGFVYDFTIYYYENQDPKKVISKILIWGHILFCTFFCFYYCTLCLAQFFTANELYVALDNRL